MFAVPFRKIIVPFLLGLLLVQSAGAQKGNAWSRATSHHFDQRDFNLGFSMGIIYSGYNVTSQIEVYNPDLDVRLKNIRLVRKPGIYLGLITNLELFNNADLRLMPSVTLEQRDFNFNFYSKVSGEADSLIVKKIENSNLNFPLVIKFKSDYYDKYRVWASIGAQFSVNLASNKKVLNDPELLKVLSTDLALIAGTGIDLYGDKLKLNPELRYVMGFRNIYVPKNTNFATAIGDLMSQNLMFIINFE